MLMSGPHSRPLRPPRYCRRRWPLVGASCPVALRMAVACYDYNTVGHAATRGGGHALRWLPRTELFPHYTHLGLQATTTTTRTPLVTTTMTRATTTTRQSTTTPPDRQVRMTAVRALTGAWECPLAQLRTLLVACCAPPLVLALVPQTRGRVEALPLPLPPPQVLRRRRPWSTMRMSSGSCMRTQ